MGHPVLDFNRSASEYTEEVATIFDDLEDPFSSSLSYGGAAAVVDVHSSYSLPLFNAEDDETQDPSRIIQESLFSGPPANTIAPAKSKSRARTATVSLKEQVAPLLSQSFQPVPLSGMTAPIVCGQIASVKEQALGGEFAHLYPFVTRVFDSDSDAFAMVKWHLCSSQNVWDICTSAHLFSGCSKSMAWYLQFAVKQLLGDLRPFIKDAVHVVLVNLTGGTRGISVTTKLHESFIQCLNCAGVLDAMRSALTRYNAQKAYVIRFKPFVFPEVSPVLVDTLRVAAMMVDPSCMHLFGQLANPQQDKAAVDFPELRIVAVRQRLLEQIASEFFNNTMWSPQANPDISSWTNMDLDVSVPHEQRSWIWIAQRMAEIKSGMSTLLYNFKKSGDLADEANHQAGDLQFWTNFAKSQPKWLWIYFAWDRGNNAPAWNVSLLPSDQQLDIASHDYQDSGKKKQRAASPGRVTPLVAQLSAVPETEFSQLMKVSSEYCKFALASSLASTTSAKDVSCSSDLKLQQDSADIEKLRASQLESLLSQLKLLQASIVLMPGDMHAQTELSIRVVAGKIASFAD